MLDIAFHCISLPALCMQTIWVKGERTNCSNSKSSRSVILKKIARDLFTANFSALKVIVHPHLQHMICLAWFSPLWFDSNGIDKLFTQISLQLASILKLMYLKCYYDENIFFFFSLDSDLIFCKNAPCQLLHLNLKNKSHFFNYDFSFKLSAIPDYVLVKLHWESWIERKSDVIYLWV